MWVQFCLGSAESPAASGRADSSMPSNARIGPAASGQVVQGHRYASAATSVTTAPSWVTRTVK